MSAMCNGLNVGIGVSHGEALYVVQGKINWTQVQKMSTH
jgi:hypothetical protein